jgi:hypothetical protein
VLEKGEIELRSNLRESCEKALKLEWPPLREKRGGERGREKGRDGGRDIGV